MQVIRFNINNIKRKTIYLIINDKVALRQTEQNKFSLNSYSIQHF